MTYEEIKKEFETNNRVDIANTHTKSELTDWFKIIYNGANPRSNETKMEIAHDIYQYFHSKARVDALVKLIN